MNNSFTISPCTGVCRQDEASGWCVGSARTTDEITGWRDRSPAFREAVWRTLPPRFVTLGVTCPRMPSTVEDIRAFAHERLAAGTGSVVMGVVGAVDDFAVAPGETIIVLIEGDAVTARTALRMVIDQCLRALAFDAVDDPSQRIALVTLREKGRRDRNSGLTDLESNKEAIDPAARTDQL